MPRGRINSSGAYEIYAEKWNGTVWVAAGIGAASGGGVSNSGGMASSPKLAAGDGQLYLVWLDNRILNFTGNTVALYAETWDGNAFVQQVPGEASFRGIGNASDAPAAPALAVDSSGQPFVAWQDSSSGANQIYLRADTFDLNTTLPLRYVNVVDPQNATVCTAPGSPANDGLSPGTPKDSVADVLSDTTNPVQPGDVVFVDAGALQRRLQPDLG